MTTPTDRETEASEAGLFEDLPVPSEAQVLHAREQAAGKRSHGAPRLLQPNRSQVELRASDLDRCWLKIIGRGWCGAMLCGRI
jgi:hypothetical protein